MQGKKSKNSKSDYENFQVFDNFSVFVEIHNLIYKLLNCGKWTKLTYSCSRSALQFRPPYDNGGILFLLQKQLSRKKFPIIIGLTATPKTPSKTLSSKQRKTSPGSFRKLGLKNHHWPRNEKQLRWRQQFQWLGIHFLHPRWAAFHWQKLY